LGIKDVDSVSTKTHSDGVYIHFGQPGGRSGIESRWDEMGCLRKDYGFIPKIGGGG